MPFDMTKHILTNPRFCVECGRGLLAEALRFHLDGGSTCLGWCRPECFARTALRSFAGEMVQRATPGSKGCAVCGGVILADTEDWPAPLCPLHAPQNLLNLLDAIISRRIGNA